MQVPRITRQVEQGNTNVNYNAPIVPAAMGTATAQALGSAGQQLGQFVQQQNQQRIEEQKTVNNINVRDNLAKALDEYNTGYSNIMSLKGQNVLARKEEINGQQTDTLSASQQAKKLAIETREKYMASFDNDIARNAFAQTFDGNVSGTQRQVLEHERTQANIAAVESHKALETTLSNTFLTNIVTGNIDGANASILTAIDSNNSIGNHLGWSQESKEANKQIMQNTMISNAVTSLLKDKKIDEAEKVISYYGDKIDEKTKLILDAAITPLRTKRDTDAVVADVYDRYGLNNKRDALQYLKSAYGNNPGYEHFVTATKAKYTDETMLKNQEDTKYRKDMANSIYSAGSLTEQISLINNSNLDPKEKHDLLKIVNSDSKKAVSKDPLDIYYNNYAKSGLIRHLKLRDEYYERLADGDEIDPKEQSKYDNATKSIIAYNAYKGMGDTTTKFTKKETTQHESDMWSAITQLANSGISKDEIVKKINSIAPKYGFDPQYFIDNAEWSKTGNITGGVK